MSSQISTQSSDIYEGVERYCRCGLRAPIRTSMTMQNPGRRFFGCVNYNTVKEACNYFDWVDPPLCARGRQFALEMMEKNLALKHKVVKLQEQNFELKDILSTYQLREKRGTPFLVHVITIAIVLIGVIVFFTRNDTNQKLYLK